MTDDANITMNTPTGSSAGGFLTSGSTPLPKDIIERARERVKIAALVFAATWSVVLIMNEGVSRLASRTPDLARLWGPRQLAITLLGFAASLSMAWLASRMKDRPERVLDLGLAFEVFNALLISLIIEWYPRHDPQAVSWVCVTIVLWPAIAPSSPRKTLIAALAAATTIPLAIWYGISIHPDPETNWFTILWLIVPGYVCAALAVVPATVIRGLGKQVKKARELGSYQLEGLLGKGGMGEVYRAKHRLLARPAAVKLISPAALRGSSDGENRIVIERFRREAEAAATLRSPHTIEL